MDGYCSTATAVLKQMGVENQLCRPAVTHQTKSQLGCEIKASMLCTKRTTIVYNLDSTARKHPQNQSSSSLAATRSSNVSLRRDRNCLSVDAQESSRAVPRAPTRGGPCRKLSRGSCVSVWGTTLYSCFLPRRSTTSERPEGWVRIVLSERLARDIGHKALHVPDVRKYTKADWR